MPFSRNKLLPIAVVVLRVVLGGIFIYAGYVKLAEPWQLFAAGIADYEVVPMWVAKLLAHTLPWFEVLIGLLLIAGRWFRCSTVSTSLLLLVFFRLGSDIPFFLQTKPALATGRGEKIQSLDFFPALRGASFLLVHPGFGISTAWAYQNLARFPAALNGTPGRAQKLISLLQTADLPTAGAEFYNSLEAPALEKFPILALYQEFLRANGAAATPMSGSGSTTFAIVQSQTAAEIMAEKFKARFGQACWIAVVPV